MAASRSQLYPIIRQAFATGAYDWATGTPKLLLMATGYNPDFTNQHLSDVDSGSIIATSPTITGLSATNGVCNGSSVNFGVISSPTEAGTIILYNDTGTPSTSKLIAFFDTPDLPGMPQVLDGLEYFFYENVSYGGWFRL